ncbi:MAG: hypothetical protein K2Z81_22670 [Cyanobacteria bacterium]|nr:hypothetical protein [Cyanobacteriota bacterium]
MVKPPSSHGRLAFDSKNTKTDSKKDLIGELEKGAPNTVPGIAFDICAQHCRKARKDIGQYLSVEEKRKRRQPAAIW